jgi:FkbM family methyltransferase
MNPLAYLRLWRDWLRANQAAGSFLFETAPLPGANLWKRWHTNSFLLKLKNFPLDRGAKCIVDVGANVGLFSRAAELYCPEAAILAVEPSNLAFAELSKVGGKRIIPIQSAVGAAAGTATLFIAEHLASSTLALPGEYAKQVYGSSGLPSGATEEVPVVTLADLLDSHRVNKVDLLKIDVEGFEPQVLEGAGAWLGPRIERIIMEVSIGRLNLEGGLDLIRTLAHKGYVLTNIVDVCRSSLSPAWPVGHFDAWFVHRSRLAEPPLSNHA